MAPCRGTLVAWWTAAALTVTEGSPVRGCRPPAFVVSGGRPLSPGPCRRPCRSAPSMGVLDRAGEVGTKVAASALLGLHLLALPAAAASAIAPPQQPSFNLIAALPGREKKGAGEQGAVSRSKVRNSVQTIQGLSPYLDEVEYLITARQWDYLKSFLGVLVQREGDFVQVIDGSFPAQNKASTLSREAMQYEAENFFLSVDDLYDAAKYKKVKGAERSYMKLALAYDRFLKAGGINPIYDPVTSTEPFFRDVGEDQLKYDRDSKKPVAVRDEVLILKGPDKGRTGRAIGVIKSRGEAVVKLDGRAREVKLLELQDVARQLSDDAAP